MMCFEYEPCEVFNDDIVKARKQHACCVCQSMIGAGELYRRFSGIFEGSAFTYAVCPECESSRENIRIDEESRGCPGYASWIHPADLAEYLGHCPELRGTREHGMALLEELRFKRREVSRIMQNMGCNYSRALQVFNERKAGE